MSALDVLRDQLREQSPPPTVNEIQERLERLRVQLADLIETQAQLLIEQWRSENPGQEPEEIRPGEAVHQWIHENLWVEASRDSDWLAEELWARNSPAWVVRAASLIEARTIDGLPLPQHRDDPITREVAAAVEEDLAHEQLSFFVCVVDDLALTHCSGVTWPYPSRWPASAASWDMNTFAARALPAR